VSAGPFHGRARRRDRLRGDKRKQLRLPDPASPRALAPERAARRTTYKRAGPFHGRARRRDRLRGDKRKQLRLPDPASPRALAPERAARRTTDKCGLEYTAAAVYGRKR
jgi:hypothetical protein